MGAGKQHNAAKEKADEDRVPPGKDTDGWLNLFRSGLWRLAYRLTPEARRRYNDDFLPLLHDAKAEVMGARDGECYYLVYIGTKPNARKRGYAGKLLDDMIARVSFGRFSSGGQQ